MTSTPLLSLAWALSLETVPLSSTLRTVRASPAPTSPSSSNQAPPLVMCLVLLAQLAQASSLAFSLLVLELSAPAVTLLQSLPLTLQPLLLLLQPRITEQDVSLASPLALSWLPWSLWLCRLRHRQTHACIKGGFFVSFLFPCTFFPGLLPLTKINQTHTQKKKKIKIKIKIRTLSSSSTGSNARKIMHPFLFLTPPVYPYFFHPFPSLVLFVLVLFLY
ncbi:hypothetical protein H106_00665 [Trichophyton rubrum CBS 735.88]|nr:hypothetical protein H106_00665 [Trichophyton rubrum CBS 735.88]